MATGQDTVAHTPAQAAHPSGWAFDPIRYLDEIPPALVVTRCVHEGEPMPKQRPRLAPRTGRVYTPGSTKDHQRAIALLVAAHIGGVAPDGEWAFGIRAAFYVQTHVRKDVDNMLKTVLDAMNRLVFADDSQVKELMGWSAFDQQRPRTELVVYRLHRIDRELGSCVRCGTTFRRYKSWKQRLYCSRKCNLLHASTAVDVPCAGCGKTILRAPHRLERTDDCDRYCSVVCRSQSRRVSLPCSHCGAVLSRQRSSVRRPGQKHYFCGRVCQAEWRTGRPMGIPPEVRGEINRRAWTTRKAKLEG